MSYTGSKGVNNAWLLMKKYKSIQSLLQSQFKMSKHEASKLQVICGIASNKQLQN